MTTAILSLLGVIVGAMLQFFFARHLEGKRHHREVRAKAYADYLQCVSELANVQPQRQSVEGRQLGARTADAKCRVSLYGSAAVVSAFASFERLGATMNTSEQRSAFTAMVGAMREDALGGSSVQAADLEIVLLGAHDAT
ncbi:hypothetical protein [Ottowia testudinis]|uniref:Uncharacterized protein n=1 Tax=Ottowia testudinis TaxID=2816950 RepID=A0A975CGW2_9BURK|nr:hypothetical protein [Ottowia testudinis]QTD45552.1 hypothetical protein J1M35_01075 [Ottowia testudinis]